MHLYEVEARQDYPYSADNYDFPELKEWRIPPSLLIIAPRPSIARKLYVAENEDVEMEYTAKLSIRKLAKDFPDDETPRVIWGFGEIEEDARL